MNEHALLGERVVTPEGVRDAAVIIRGEKIAAVLPRGELPAGLHARDVGELVLMPGLVDSHVHVNEPGRTEWEGFETATRAAAAGGITTIVDMPLNCIPVTTTREALRIKRDAVASLLGVDVALWGGVVPGNAGELAGMAADGIAGAKAFLVHSGIDEFPAASESDLRAAMRELRRLGLPLIAHAELGEHLHEPPAGTVARDYASFLASRPPAAEDEAIRLLVRLCEETGCRTHVVHLSSASALPLVAGARARGLPFSAETCPHYLALAAEDVPDGRTEYKCAPPIRSRENQAALWAALGAGTLDLVVSDHSPCTPQLKGLEKGDFMSAWGGISSVQLSLPAVWTAARERGIDLAQLARWMSERPARLAGLASKGRIAAGADADFTLFDPDAPFVVEAARLHHKNKLTPYAGRALRGVVRETILRGETIYSLGANSDATFAGPRGRLLARS